MTWRRLAPRKCHCGKVWMVVSVRSWGLAYLCGPCWLAYYLMRDVVAEAQEDGLYG